MQQHTTTNNNNNPALSPELMQAVQAEVQNCLHTSVQCVTTEGAAKLLSVEPGTIRTYIKKGTLPASKIGKDYCILITDIRQLLNRTAVVIRMDKRFKSRAI